MRTGNALYMKNVGCICNS